MLKGVMLHSAAFKELIENVRTFNAERKLYILMLWEIWLLMFAFFIWIFFGDFFDSYFFIRAASTLLNVGVHCFLLPGVKILTKYI